MKPPDEILRVPGHDVHHHVHQPGEDDGSLSYAFGMFCRRFKLDYAVLLFPAGVCEGVPDVPERIKGTLAPTALGVGQTPEMTQLAVGMATALALLASRIPPEEFMAYATTQEKT